MLSFPICDRRRRLSTASDAQLRSASLGVKEVHNVISKDLTQNRLAYSSVPLISTIIVSIKSSNFLQLSTQDIHKEVVSFIFFLFFSLSSCIFMVLDNR